MYIVRICVVNKSLKRMHACEDFEREEKETVELGSYREIANANK